LFFDLVSVLEFTQCIAMASSWAGIRRAWWCWLTQFGLVVNQPGK